MVMRKILLVALTAAAMVGCSENEGFENENTVNRIKFGTVVKTGTRTLVATTENFSKFTVSAYKTTDEMGGTVQLNTGFMDDIEVDKSSGEWKYKATTTGLSPVNCNFLLLHRRKLWMLLPLPVIRNSSMR